jgi:hypothetical protein
MHRLQETAKTTRPILKFRTDEERHQDLSTLFPSSAWEHTFTKLRFAVHHWKQSFRKTHAQPELGHEEMLAHSLTLSSAGSSERSQNPSPRWWPAAARGLTVQDWERAPHWPQAQPRRPALR